LTLRIQNVSIDCLDPARLAAFWAEALGWRITSNEPHEVVLEPRPHQRKRASPRPPLSVGTEDRVTKNRLHFDLRPSDQYAEVQRLLGLGATEVDVGQSPECTWVVLGDPEGNEFCVLRPFTDEEMASFA